MAVRSFNRSELTEVAQESREPMVLFEEEVPVQVRLDSRESITQPLGVKVVTGRGGTNGTTRCVTVQVTDHRDPFFLFTMALLEDDYGRFKERHELNVDFSGFPKHFVSMLTTVLRGGSGHVAEFVTDTTQSGKLRIVEKTEFRLLEVLTLQLQREGDVGQKHYLAERFMHFEQCFLRCRAESEDEAAAQAAVIAELRNSLEGVQIERDELRDALKVQNSVAETSQANSVAVVKDEATRELRQHQAAFENERVQLQQRLDAAVQQYQSDIKLKEEELTGARQRIGNLEAAEIHLQSQLRMSQETLKAQGNELARLNNEHEQLSSYRSTASKSLVERELQEVASKEQIKHLTATLERREQECGEYRAKDEKREGYVSLMTEQLRDARERLKESESSIQKSHHIINKQFQKLNSAKEKQTALLGQLQSEEQISSDARNNSKRLEDNNAFLNERIAHFESTVTALKQQLQKTEDEKRQMTEELTQSKDALAHMYKTASSVTPRVHAYSAHTASLYSDFSKNMTQPHGSVGSATPTSVPPPTLPLATGLPKMSTDSLGENKPPVAAGVKPAAPFAGAHAASFSPKTGYAGPSSGITPYTSTSGASPQASTPAATVPAAVNVPASSPPRQSAYFPQN